MPTRTAVVEGTRRQPYGVPAVRNAIERYYPSGFEAYRQLPTNGLNYNLVRNAACAPSSVVDYFERTDNASSLGTANSGHTWNALSGTWGVTSNGASCSTGGTTTSAVIDCGFSDGTITAQLLNCNNTTIGVCFRVQDNDNMLYVRAGSTEYSIYQAVAGVHTQIVAYNVSPANGDVIKVVMFGPSIKVYVNGTLGITYSTTLYQNNTKHGIRENGSVSTLGRVKSFRFDPYGVSIGDQSYWTLHQNASLIRDNTSTTGYALKLVSTAGFQASPQRIAVEPGSTISVSYFLRGDGTNSDVYLDWRDNGGADLFPGVAHNDIVGVSTANWSQVQLLNITVPGNAAYVDVNIANNTNTGTLYFTGLRVTQQATTPAWSVDMQHYPGGNNTVLDLVTGICLYEAATNVATATDESLPLGTQNGFNDPFADLNAWTTIAGVPSVATNLVTLAANASMKAGHTEWWDMSAGTQVRFKWATGGTARFVLRWVDAQNYVFLDADGANFWLGKVVGGATTVPIGGFQAAVLTNGSFYWFNPVISGTTYSATLVADNAGADTGATKATISAQTISDAAVATGQIALWAIGATIQFGGAFSNVCRVVVPSPNLMSTGVSAGVPAFCMSKTTKSSGQYSLSIFNNNAGAQGQWFVSYTTTGTVTFSARVKTSSVVGNAVLSADNGVTGATATGTTDWTTLSTTVTNAASKFEGLRMFSASGTVWFDNIWLAAQGYDTGNSDPTGKAYTTGGRLAGRASANPPSGMSMNDTLALIVFSPDVITSTGKDKEPFTIMVDSNNLIRITMFQSGTVTFDKVRASTVESRVATGPTLVSGDTFVGVIRFRSGYGTKGFWSVNGGAVGSGFDNSFTGNATTAFASPTVATIACGWNNTLTPDNRTALIRVLNTGMTDAAIQALMLKPYSAPTGQDLAIYTFDGGVRRVW